VRLLLNALQTYDVADIIPFLLFLICFAPTFSLSAKDHGVCSAALLSSVVLRRLDLEPSAPNCGTRSRRSSAICVDVSVAFDSFVHIIRFIYLLVFFFSASTWSKIFAPSTLASTRLAVSPPCTSRRHLRCFLLGLCYKHKPTNGDECTTQRLRMTRSYHELKKRAYATRPFLFTQNETGSDLRRLPCRVAYHSTSPRTRISGHLGKRSTARLKAIQRGLFLQVRFLFLVAKLFQ
jgi:hypothetical protein